MRYRFCLFRSLGILSGNNARGRSQLFSVAVEVRLICTVYMVAGGLYWKYEQYVRKMMKPRIVLTILVVNVVCAVLFTDYLYDGYMTSLLKICPSGVLFSIMASVLLIELCKRMKETEVLSYIGQNSYERCVAYDSWICL